METSKLFGLKRLKAELVFILASGVQVDKSFSYEQQRDFYIKEIFGNKDSAREIVNFGQSFKMSSKYMFPNNPREIHNPRLLIKFFADCILLNHIFCAGIFETVMEKEKIFDSCLQDCDFLSGSSKMSFQREIEFLYEKSAPYLSQMDYDEFKEVMTKFRDNFLKVFQSIEGCIDQKQKNSDGNSFEMGLSLLEIDLIFILAGGVKFEKNFSYEQQRDFYIREIFGNKDFSREVVDFGKNYRRFSEYMFPNKPENVRTRKFLIESFAECFLINQIFVSENYRTAVNDEKLRRDAESFAKYLDVGDEDIFVNEARRRSKKYVESLSEKDYETFLAIFRKFEKQFNEVFRTLQKFICKQVLDVASKDKNLFDVLCESLGVAANIKKIFKLKLEALAEIQIGKNEYINYFESLKNDWSEKIPEYEYSDEVENYVRQEHPGCIFAFGNKLGTIRNERLLFDLVASVNLKLALAEGATDLSDLKKRLAKKTEKLSDENLKNAFKESVDKIVDRYSLADEKIFDENIKDELVPFRVDLLYTDEILIDEISRRNEIVTAMKQNESNKINSEREKKLERVIEQKEAEISELKRDIEYYEKIQSQGFRNEAQKYEEVFEKLFKHMCNQKYGAPLNELYLMSLSEEDIKSEEIKTIVKNLLFVFTVLGITPYETKNIGKVFPFDSEDANVVYAVDEKNLVEGINKGKVKYPGWKYREKQIILPFVVTEKENESHA